MTTRRIMGTVILLASAGAIIYGVYRYHQHSYLMSQPESETNEIQPVAWVETIPIREGAIDVATVTFGTVEAASGETQTTSIPFESRVCRVLVISGQQVQSDDPLIELEPSPDTTLQYQQARQQRDSAKNQLELIRQRFDLKLATQQDLLQAQQAFSETDLKLQSMKKRGIAGHKIIHATASGVVSSINAQQGQIVPAGLPLLETIGQNQIVVRVGVESGDASRMHPGQKATIEPVFGADETLEGTIQKITQEVNPQTRLVNVYITPPPSSHLLIHEYVRSRIIIDSRHGLIVPLQAILHEESGYVIYTVVDGHSVRHGVTLGPADEKGVLVTGQDLQAGRQVVTVGASQLQDGMTVKVESSQQ